MSQTGTCFRADPGPCGLPLQQPSCLGREARPARPLHWFPAPREAWSPFPAHPGHGVPPRTTTERSAGARVASGTLSIPLPCVFLPAQQWGRGGSPAGLPCLVPQGSSIWASSSGCFPELRGCAGSCRWNVCPGRFLNSPVREELTRHHTPLPSPASSPTPPPSQGLSLTLRVPLSSQLSCHAQDRRKSCSCSSSRYLRALSALSTLPPDKPEAWFLPSCLPSFLPLLSFFLSLPPILKGIKRKRSNNKWEGKGFISAMRTGY